MVGITEKDRQHDPHLRLPVTAHGSDREQSLSENGCMAEWQLEQLRTIALALLGVTERGTHGAVGFFLQRRRPICYFHDDHRGDGRVSLWFPSSPAAQDELVSAEPRRFFRPTASASGTFSSWLGIFLDLPGDDAVDWQEIAAVVHEAYRSIAPSRLIADLDHQQWARPSVPGPGPGGGGR